MEQERKPVPDHYEILQVHPKASLIVIKKAYRALLLELGNHPDKGGSPEQTRLLNEAYRVLNDPKRRQEYDATLAERAPKKTGPLFMVACSRCGVFNRVQSEELISTARCGRCGRPLSRIAARSNRRLWFSLSLGLAGMLLLFCFGSALPFRFPVLQKRQALSSPLEKKSKKLAEPNDFASLLAFADLLVQRGEGVKAVPLYLNLAAIDQERGRMEEALALFQKASALRDEDPEIHFQLGEIQRGLGHSREAVREFHACLVRARRNPILTERVLRALRSMGAE